MHNYTYTAHRMPVGKNQTGVVVQADVVIMSVLTIGGDMEARAEVAKYLAVTFDRDTRWHVNLTNYVENA